MFSSFLPVAFSGRWQVNMCTLPISDTTMTNNNNNLPHLGAILSNTSITTSKAVQTTVLQRAYQMLVADEEDSAKNKWKVEWTFNVASSWAGLGSSVRLNSLCPATRCVRCVQRSSFTQVSTSVLWFRLSDGHKMSPRLLIFVSIFAFIHKLYSWEHVGNIPVQSTQHVLRRLTRSVCSIAQASIVTTVIGRKVTLADSNEYSGKLEYMPALEGLDYGKVSNGCSG